MIEAELRSKLGDHFDKVVRSLEGTPDTTKVTGTTVRHYAVVTDNVQTFIVQTYRKREVGDYILVEYVGAEGSVRLVLPPEVAAVVARQRDALTSKNRRASSKATAAARKAAGIKPAFLTAKPKPKKK